MKQKLKHLWIILGVPLLEPWKVVRRRRFHFVAWLLSLPGLAREILTSWSRVKITSRFSIKLTS